MADNETIAATLTAALLHARVAAGGAQRPAALTGVSLDATGVVQLYLEVLAELKNQTSASPPPPPTPP
jgi:hypothetical protein